MGGGRRPHLPSSLWAGAERPPQGPWGPRRSEQSELPVPVFGLSQAPLPPLEGAPGLEGSRREPRFPGPAQPLLIGRQPGTAPARRGRRAWCPGAVGHRLTWPVLDWGFDLGGPRALGSPAGPPTGQALRAGGGVAGGFRSDPRVPPPSGVQLLLVLAAGEPLRSQALPGNTKGKPQQGRARRKGGPRAL